MDNVGCGVKRKFRFLRVDPALNRLLAAFFVSLLVVSITAADGAHILSFSLRHGSIFKIGKESYDLKTEDGIAKLKYRAAELVASERKGNALSKRDARGLAEIVHLAQRFSEDESVTSRAAHKHAIQEIASAMANNHRSPVPEYVGLLDLPIRFAATIHNPVGRGDKPASNIVPTESADLSEVNPQVSSYWERPISIPDADLYSGFERVELPFFDNCIWNYAGPKKSGANAGCELACESRRIKVKFAEVHSEPFIGRVFHALGYNVDPSDYAPRLRIRYDRRFFTEFNSRRPIEMKIGMLFIPLYTFHFEESYDPFAYIDHAVLKGERTVSASDLKRRLLRDPERKHAESDPENFRTEVESEIEYLVTVEVNVQVEGNSAKSIGPWDFDRMGRQHLRELRGAGVLAAWVGWWDSRFENTRVRLVKTSGDAELKHFFTDLGSGMGKSGGTFHHSSEEPNDFPWSFTRGRAMRQNGKTAWRFEITDFEPITETKAFKEITFDDARWMARLIAQLSKEQIVSALIASGFDSAKVRIYTEKLLARRDQLIRDTRLDGEFSLLGSGQQDLNYDPAVDGPVRVRTAQGLELQAPVGQNILRNGRVEPRR